MVAHVPLFLQQVENWQLFYRMITILSVCVIMRMRMSYDRLRMR